VEELIVSFCQQHHYYADMFGLGKSSDRRQLRVLDWLSPTILFPSIDSQLSHPNDSTTMNARFAGTLPT
jgi:hypothetical protein